MAQEMTTELKYFSYLIKKKEEWILVLRVFGDINDPVILENAVILLELTFLNEEQKLNTAQGRIKLLFDFVDNKSSRARLNYLLKLLEERFKLQLVRLRSGHPIDLSYDQYTNYQFHVIRNESDQVILLFGPKDEKLELSAETMAIISANRIEDN